MARLQSKRGRAPGIAKKTMPPPQIWRHRIHFRYHPNVPPCHNHTPHLRIRIPTTCQPCSRGGGSSSPVTLSPRAPESGRRTAHGGHWHLWPPRAQANFLSLETGASWCFTVLHRGRCRRRTKLHRNTGISNEVQHVQNIANPVRIESPHQKEWSRITMRETGTITYQTNNFQQPENIGICQLIGTICG